MPTSGPWAMTAPDLRATRRPSRPVGRGLWAVVAVAAVVAAGCGDGALRPAGREASRVAAVWWIMFALAAVIFVAVLVLLGVALRARRDERHQADPADATGGGTDSRGGTDRGSDDVDVAGGPIDPGRGGDVGEPQGVPRFAGERLVVVGGIVVPAVVLSVLLGVTIWAGDGLRREGADGALRVELTGHQYWWDVRYPDHGVRTANEVHLPVGREVQLVLRSDDVIHSVWVPRLGGKLDLVPGRTNRMTIRADEPGEYRGVCAEFCGLQHARMKLRFVAVDEDGFTDWVRRSAEERATPTDERLREGWETFMSASCVYCHRIAGTPASSEFGPDLTDLASRRTLGAGVVPNTRGHLAGWILDPQRLKPGNEMPGTRLPADRLDALLDFLETLE